MDMMTTYAIPLWLVIFFLSFVLLCLILTAIFMTKTMKRWLSDKIMIIDKNNRWKIYHTRLRGVDEKKIGGKTYIFDSKSGLLNIRGKAFFLFSENNPAGAKIIEHKKVEWLDGKSLTGFINNKLAQQIIKPTDKLIDTLIVIGAIGGIIAGLASVVILLIETGVIAGVTT